MTSLTSLHVLAALFAVYMLVRHLPRARARSCGGRAARGRWRSSPRVNVLLALAILAVRRERARRRPYLSLSGSAP